MPQTCSNAISFVDSQGGVEMYLTLDTDWVVSGGDRPNINVATVKASEFNQRKGLTGVVNFYFTSSPEDADGDPDVSLSGITIVDVQVGRIGAIKSDGDPSIQIIDLKVSFADVRHQLIPPRGGVLMLGDVNLEPFVGDPSAAASLTSNTDLITKCLDATGQDWELGDGDFDACPPMRKLQWYGARAPEELSKILQWVGGVLYPTTDGGLGVDLLGSGDGAPEIDSEDLIATLYPPVIDRRGKTVVFISAPTAGQMIYDGTGESGEGEGPPSWDFVARDTDGTWQTLDDNSILDGLDPEEEVQNGFADVPDQYVQQMVDDVYHCIQLDTDDHDPLVETILKQIARPDGYLDDINATATIAIRNPKDGSWSNSDDPVNLQATHIYGGYNVIRFSERIGQVDPSPTLDADGNFEAIDPSDIKIKFGTESPADSGDGKGYFACGFNDPDANGNVQTLDSGAVTSALQGGDDIVVLHAPSMRLRRLNGEKMPDAENFADLQSDCMAIATQVLAGSSDPPQMIVARGYYTAELSGKVSEVRYNQANATTTIRVNSWFAPATAFQVDPGVARSLATSRTLAGGGQPGGEAHPVQAASITSRSSLGESGAQQPLHVVGASAPAIVMRYDCAVQVESNETGTGIYDGNVADVPLEPNTSNGVQINFHDENGNTTKALILNIGERSGGAGSSGTHAIPPDRTTLFGMRGPITDDGKTIVWTYYDPYAYRAFQYIADPAGSGNMLFQGSIVPLAPKTDPSWVTLLTFTKGCS